MATPARDRPAGRTMTAARTRSPDRWRRGRHDTSAPTTRFSSPAKRVSVTIAPAKLPGLRLYCARPTLNRRFASCPGSSFGPPPGRAPRRMRDSEPKLTRPTLPVTLAPAIGSTMRRVCTAAYMLASPLPTPASLKMSDPCMKNGRFSEKKFGKRWFTSTWNASLSTWLKSGFTVASSVIVEREAHAAC